MARSPCCDCGKPRAPGLVRCNKCNTIWEGLPRCQARVWESGDTDDCGRPALPGCPYCERCLPLKLKDAKEKVAKLRKKLKKAEEELAMCQNAVGKSAFERL
jgi:hypothetical protein